MASSRKPSKSSRLPYFTVRGVTCSSAFSSRVSERTSAESPIARTLPGGVSSPLPEGPELCTASGEAVGLLGAPEDAEPEDGETGGVGPDGSDAGEEVAKLGVSAGVAVVGVAAAGGLVIAAGGLVIAAAPSRSDVPQPAETRMVPSRAASGTGGRRCMQGFLRGGTSGKKCAVCPDRCGGAGGMPESSGPPVAVRTRWVSCAVGRNSARLLHV